MTRIRLRVWGSEEWDYIYFEGEQEGFLSDIFIRAMLDRDYHVQSSQDGAPFENAEA